MPHQTNWTRPNSLFAEQRKTPTTKKMTVGVSEKQKLMLALSTKGRTDGSRTKYDTPTAMDAAKHRTSTSVNSNVVQNVEEAAAGLEEGAAVNNTAPERHMSKGQCDLPQQSDVH